MCELQLKEFCLKGNTAARVNITKRNDSEDEGLNGVKNKRGSQMTSLLRWKHKQKEDTNGIETDRLLEPRKHKKNAVKRIDGYPLNQGVREAECFVNEVSRSVLADTTCSIYFHGL
ncbi:hypothetical protein CEXT_210111 [Caerostris extrusa]|uniref:Uncharacterized protein n=1 Tax=Caerostris extrusa TaxID=172846 RepID=A0AAV4NW78_CAEEX|nr:hypothetical protein CEXT_210111 [Caerostris extrusa]